MFVALSRFTIANDMSDAVHAAFRDRPRLVDREPGFLGMQVLSPYESPREIWLITQWTDEASYQAWHHGPGYHASHSGIPKGLKLLASDTEIRFFNLIAD
jgi:heme-degrading monooxygenase HmoA